MMARIGGQLGGGARSSSPQRCRRATPGSWMKWLRKVSLGKAARSRRRTRYPLRARSMAVGEPAHRAPMMIASYIGWLLSAEGKREEWRGDGGRILRWRSE